jgi:FkbH-like protein
MDWSNLVKIEQRIPEIEAVSSELSEHANQAEFVVIHSALHMLGSELPSYKWRILKAISGLATEGHTVLVPSFSFSFTKGQKFLFPDGVSETGLLADWARELSAAKRTAHPIYSFSVIGPRAGEVLQCSTTTCFGLRSVFELLDRQSSRVLMFGTDWGVCTQFHYYEELFEVPYRYYKKFTGKILRNGRESSITSSMYVRNLLVNPENDFTPIVSKLRDDKKIISGRSGIIESASVSDIASVCSRLLATDPYALTANKEILKHQVEKFDRRAKNHPLVVAIYGSQNNEVLKTATLHALTRYFPDQTIRVDCKEYGQHREIFFGQQSERYDCVICVERFSHLKRAGNFGDQIKQEDLAKYISEIKEISGRLSKSVVVLTFSRLEVSQWGGYFEPSERETACLTVAQANQLLSVELTKEEGIVLVDIDTISGLGVSQTDSRLEFLARTPFSEQFSSLIASCVAGRLLARFGKSIRLLLVDLDNTLWGGVAGEDGPNGIQVGPDFPGNIFVALQRRLKSLANRGIALGIVSKNDEWTVKEIFRLHSGLPLTYQDFVATRINWESKVENIRSIAQEVGLSLATIGFLDDNPVEREEVAQMLPEVKVLPWEDDFADMPSMLDTNPYLAPWKITGEDQNKISQYHSRAKISAAQRRLPDRREFLEQLDVAIFLQNINDLNLARVVQLFNKTNQFTATGRRITGDEIEELDRESFLVLGASDRFSERENIGVICIQDAPKSATIEIKEFVLSCRALGKGIEERVLGWVVEEAYKQERIKLRARSKKLARNVPLLNLYKKYDLCDGAMRISYRSAAKFSIFNCLKVYDERKYGVFHGG